MSPRPLTKREQNLIDFYGYCSLGMTPQQFYLKWQVSHEEIAFICSRSMSTVRRWFRRGGNYRRPRATDMRHLAVMDCKEVLLQSFTQFLDNSGRQNYSSQERFRRS